MQKNNKKETNKQTIIVTGSRMEGPGASQKKSKNKKKLTKETEKKTQRNGNQVHLLGNQQANKNTSKKEARSSIRNT